MVVAGGALLVTGGAAVVTGACVVLDVVKICVLVAGAVCLGLGPDVTFR